jgi:hypothetical protein
MNKPKQKSVFDRNSTETIILPSGKIVHIPKCKTLFKLWRGKRIKDTYGGKTLLTFRGKPLFAELVTLRLLEEEGWHGVWVDSYRRKYRTGMPGISDLAGLPESQQAFLEKIRKRADCKGGCFDVFVWHGDKRWFVELKRFGKDRIQDTQRQWLEAALHCGLKSCNFLIIEWDT